MTNFQPMTSDESQRRQRQRPRPNFPTVSSSRSARLGRSVDGCRVFTHYNGPTDQLSGLCAGMGVLDPGSTPHPPHQHPEEEFLIIAAGTGEIECAGKTTPVGPGAMMYCAGNAFTASPTPEGADDVLLVQVAGEGTGLVTLIEVRRVVDHFEDVAVHRLAEEEALEGRRPERLEQLRAALPQALLERVELRRADRRARRAVRTRARTATLRSPRRRTRASAGRGRYSATRSRPGRSRAADRAR